MTRSRRLRTLSTGDRVLKALELVAQRHDTLTVKELAIELGVSLSTAYHVVHTLSASGYVLLERHRCLRPGPALYRLAACLPSPSARSEALEPLIDEIGRITGCRAYLAAWHDRDVEILYVHGRRGVRELPGLGRGFRGAAHALALGKVLLAGRDRREWPDYLDADRFPSRTPFTLTDPARLHHELETVRQHQIAYDREEFALGSCCLAVPLPPVTHEPARLAVGISLSRRRFEAEGELVSALVRQVNRLHAFGT